jgi:hypothetical protein
LARPKVSNPIELINAEAKPHEALLVQQARGTRAKLILTAEIVELTTQEYILSVSPSDPSFDPFT